MDIEEPTYRQLYLDTLPLSELTALSEKLRGEVIDLGRGPNGTFGNLPVT